MGRWLKRIAIAVAGLTVLAVLIGSGGEAFTRRQMKSTDPVQGRLVDIGGRQIQIDCRGAGSPTVVLEAGLDIYGLDSWSDVHGSMAKISRVCAYSRAGILRSDPAAGPFDSRNVAKDLHAALAAAGEAPPWVMVGHSLGGPYVMIFTGLYPAEVTGLVFVDASHPDMAERLREAAGRSFDLVPRSPWLTVGAALSWTGIVRLMPGLNEMPYASTSIGPFMKEGQAVEATLTTAGRFRNLGDRPLVVLTSTVWSPEVLQQLGLSEEQGKRMRAATRALHEDASRWSTRGRHELVDGAAHYIQFDRPDVVVQAVQEVVEAVRAADR